MLFNCLRVAILLASFFPSSSMYASMGNEWRKDEDSRRQADAEKAINRQLSLSLFLSLTRCSSCSSPIREKGPNESEGKRSIH